jgi:hypothetical protein
VNFLPVGNSQGSPAKVVAKLLAYSKEGGAGVKSRSGNRCQVLGARCQVLGARGGSRDTGLVVQVSDWELGSGGFPHHLASSRQHLILRLSTMYQKQNGLVVYGQNVSKLYIIQIRRVRLRYGSRYEETGCGSPRCSTK